MGSCHKMFWCTLQKRRMKYKHRNLKITNHEGDCGKNSIYEVHSLVPTVIYQPLELDNYMSEKSISGVKNTSIFIEDT